MDPYIKRILLVVDSSIGNEFIANEELADQLERYREMPHIRPEILLIKNTQAEFKKEVIKEFFTVKAFPRKSIKKAIKLSNTIIYMTDGDQRLRRNSLSRRVSRQISKSIIVIKTK